VKLVDSKETRYVFGKMADPGEVGCNRSIVVVLRGQVFEKRNRKP